MKIEKTTSETPGYSIILDWINERSSVLDLGCGDGQLLSLLIKHKQVKAQGIEINEAAIYKCVSRGISVFHEDIENGLNDFGDKSFDYVLLHNTFQEVKNPDKLLKEALRVGNKVIVGFPNFGHFSTRLYILFNGKTPVTASLPFPWFETPNLHFLSLADFIEYCHLRNLKIEKSFFRAKTFQTRLFSNLLAESGIFMITGYHE